VGFIKEDMMKGKEAGSPEVAIVKDGDKLWRFSKVGYWRKVERQGHKP